jgi:hypothetical protein
MRQKCTDLGIIVLAATHLVYCAHPGRSARANDLLENPLPPLGLSPLGSEALCRPIRGGVLHCVTGVVLHHQDRQREIASWHTIAATQVWQAFNVCALGVAWCGEGHVKS